MSSESEQTVLPVSDLKALLPAMVLGVLVISGLVLRPLVFDVSPIPLEMVFLAAAGFAISQLLWMGFSWEAIQGAIISRVARALPAILILMLIGPLVASWMIAGTIPMLVAWGIELINPNYLYVLAFLIAAIFSTLTGTSWGSAATVGVVLVGISNSLDANTAIVAGAVIGGAYFGDKLSPLSDTTNMAAIATGVDLFDHIRSMLWTTVPSALIAAVGYLIVGFGLSIDSSDQATGAALDVVVALQGLFNFQLILLIPVLVVLVGSMKKWPTIPVLLLSIFSAVIVASITQETSLVVMLQSLVSGVTLPESAAASALPAVTTLVERGGVYSMKEAVFVAFLVYFFVGAIDLLETMPTLVRKLFGFATTQKSTVLTSLYAAAATNALTSNQSATAFIVGDAFSKRYDNLAIPRPVLSRSIEDMGTMIESLIPWHATALFMVATLGVPVSEYWYWQFLTLANCVVAPALVLMGIGCGFQAVKDKVGNQ